MRKKLRMKWRTNPSNLRTVLWTPRSLRVCGMLCFVCITYFLGLAPMPSVVMSSVHPFLTSVLMRCRSKEHTWTEYILSFKLAGLA